MDKFKEIPPNLLTISKKSIDIFSFTVSNSMGGNINQWNPIHLTKKESSNTNTNKQSESHWSTGNCQFHRNLYIQRRKLFEAGCPHEQPPTDSSVTDDMHEEPISKHVDTVRQLISIMNTVNS